MITTTTHITVGEYTGLNGHVGAQSHLDNVVDEPQAKETGRRKHLHHQLVVVVVVEEEKGEEDVCMSEIAVLRLIEIIHGFN